MCIQRTCKRLGPVRVRRSKYYYYSQRMREGQPVNSSEDGPISRERFSVRQFCPWKLVPKVPLGKILTSWIFLWIEFNNKLAHVKNCAKPSATAIATKKKEVLTNPHMRANAVDLIVSMYCSRR